MPEYRVFRVATAVCTAAAVMLSAGCRAKDSSTPSTTAQETAQTAVVYTTFYPTAYWTERIGGEHVKVVNPCPADEDPAYWMPDEETIGQYQQADLIVVNGAAFEKWLEKVTLPAEKVVDTTKPLEDTFITLEAAVTHTHGPSGEHSHEGIDGHTWLDPTTAKTQAAQIKDALAKLRPELADAFEQGYAALVTDLDKLDARLQALQEKMKDQQLVCSHPAYNYVGRTYHWTLKNFMLDPETVPDEETIADIKKFLAENPARYMLWESAPTAEIAAKTQAELGLESIVFSPCELLDAEQLAAGVDFLTVMNENVNRLEQAFGE